MISFSSLEMCKGWKMLEIALHLDALRCDFRALYIIYYIWGKLKEFKKSDGNKIKSSRKS
jgi:hypothetical protein